MILSKLKLKWLFKNRLMKKLQLLPIFFCLLTTVFGQKNAIEGSITDSLNTPLVGASVMLLQAKDSVLTAFSITNKEGLFQLNKLSPDDYILQVSYLGYANVSQPISLAPQSEITNIGTIVLTPESALLDIVEIKSEHLPIKLKNDTVEYNAAAFQTRPNADVEALLKKLPGVEVARDGSIKAQGETVQKVLVDGKEFFGNDPKIATKNLPADAVDKVQVFDKKSDIAEFSGIDDGREAKTINLSLKEDKKNGYFGKLSGGYGTNDRYEGKFNINRFGRKIQASGIGMFNNTNQQGFSINDYINMMGGLNNLLAGGSGSIELNLDSEEIGLPLDGGQKNNGFTNTSAGGINLNWEMNDRTKLSANYFYNHIKKDIDRQEFRQSILGSQIFTTDKNARTIRTTQGHRLNLFLASKIDSFQTIKWRSVIGYNNRLINNNSFSQNFNTNEQLENTGARNYTADGDNFLFNTNLTYLRKFRKRGRFFTSSIALEKRSINSDAALAAINRFFLNGMTLDSLQQENIQDREQNNYGLGLTYTEPLGKKKYLEINYNFQNHRNELIQNVYNIQERARQLDQPLSNHFQRDYLYHRWGLNYKWLQKKWHLTTGLAAQQSNLQGRLLLDNIQIQKSFFNILPKLNFDYDFKTTQSLQLNYSTSVQEPSLEQLQPIVDNSDPLNIYEGNPDLTREYLHNIRLNFNFFDQFNNISLFTNLTATFIDNPIINSREVDQLFRQKIRPVNYGQSKNFGAYFSYGMPIKFLKSRLNIHSSYDSSIGNYLVNHFVDRFSNQRISLDLSLSNKNTDILDLTIGAKCVKNKIQYQQETMQNQQYNQMVLYTDAALNIGKHFTISSTLDYTHYSATSFSAALNLPIW